jgi:5'-3' exoribonuclease 1
MGVPRLFPWLVKSFPRAVKHFQQGEYTQKVSYLYLDANGLLHAAAQEVFHYGTNKKRINRYVNLTERDKRKKTFTLFFENLLQVTQIIRPTKLLYIAIDGPAPLAKQAQQRQRRFVASKTRLEEEESSSSSRFDSNSITPGTLFMHELTRYINFAIRKEMNTYPSWKNIDVIFSPPTVAGEGEHKIMDYIRSLPEKERTTENHCLFGPDGDLIMLTLAAHISKMWLFREDQYTPGYYHMLDMGYIRTELAETLGQADGVNAKTRDLKDVTDDFIIEGFFVGNDFLPKIQMFHLLEDGIEFMLGTYARTSSGGRTNFLTVDNHLDITGFKVFVESLSQNENEFLIDQVTTRDPKKTPPDAKFRNETLLGCITEVKRSGKPGSMYRLDFEKYRKRYYVEKCKFPDPDNKPVVFSVRLEELCRDYLRSFVWVFEYYVHGLPAWSWAYEHHYAPLMDDFNDYIQNLKPTDFQKIVRFDIQTPSLPFEQLLSVLPPPSANLLPSPYQRLMLNPESPLVKAGYYPDNFEIDYEGKLKEYQGIALLPFVDYDVIHTNYIRMTKCCIKDPKKYVRNSRGNVALFRYDPKYRARFTSDMGNIDVLRVRKKFI